MSKVLDFIKENELAWQPSFNAKINDTLNGYRGALIVEEGKALSADRKLPPKIQVKQVIMVCDEDVMKFFTCELDSFNDFKPMFEKYKEFFTADGIYVLYVTDLEGEGTFTYDGVEFIAFALDESSVWNEILELADLEKGDMKRLSAEEKIDTLYDEIQDCDIKEQGKSFEEMCELIGESSKQLMGAV